jgi:hypothetical protein
MVRHDRRQRERLSGPMRVLVLNPGSSTLKASLVADGDTVGDPIEVGGQPATRMPRGLSTTS